jgi:hypothetical protein
MFAPTPKCKPVAAPSMVLPPEPAIVAARGLRVAYRTSSGPGGDDRWVVVHFLGCRVDVIWLSLLGLLCVHCFSSLSI